ncbi:hypothetical protein OAS18_05550 [Nitrospinaceae bacterium]|nr:hypothetical protein [Nitrospinaceae bacterium]
MGEDLWVSIYEILGNIKGRIDMGEDLWGNVLEILGYIWSRISSWNWNTIFLGVIALYSLENNLAINSQGDKARHLIARTAVELEEIKQHIENNS